jgi:hypothetical protein
MRLIFEKGMISPELTEAMIGAFAPEALDSARAAQQAASPAPVPPELQQIFQGAPPEAAQEPSLEPTPELEEQ